MLALRALTSGGYRMPPPHRNFNTHRPQISIGNYLGRGVLLVSAGAVAALALYKLTNKEQEEKTLSQKVVEITLCKVSKAPSLKQLSERHLVAYTLARTSDKSCQHLIYNMIIMNETQDNEVIEFLVELTRQTTHIDANPEAKATLARWLVLLKKRQGDAHQILLTRLHKEGFLSQIFSERAYQKNSEGCRLMAELKSDWLDLKHKNRL